MGYLKLGTGKTSKTLFSLDRFAFVLDMAAQISVSAKIYR